ncbi:hypothetical protein BEH_17470 [Priestia filamentosa]|uniref:Glycosyltransferase 2-like domain-containing protein n=1 Tax=Priestia filamentosa TaxID=1402861 RepID=A0A2S1LZI4_9BACI|nr:glycosyltransferase [Priestia filamentosa]AWG44219.1 hypothetical protein BEH_17470 [Priestia filamentosa]
MFSIIVPTLGNRIPELERLLNSLIKQSGVSIELIIAAQDNFEALENLLGGYSQDFNIKFLKLHKKGLSYARNAALEHVSGDALTFSDDDCWYPEDILEKVYRELQSAQVCTFQIYDPHQNLYYKTYSNTSLLEHRKISRLFKVSSIEIFVNLKNVKREDLEFDERFGLGAYYPSGEEVNLLIDLLRKGYKFNYIPTVAVYHQKNGHRLNDKSLEVKGAFLARNFSKPLCLVLGIGFVVKKSRYVGLNFSSITPVFKGIKSFQQDHGKLK